MRVDMFMTGQEVYVQEYSPNPMNGLRHCASKTDSNGCIDSCFLGREWNAAGGGVYGGAATAAQGDLDTFLEKSTDEQCGAMTSSVVAPTKYASSCNFDLLDPLSSQEGA
jgi:hypothetical protein